MSGLTTKLHVSCKFKNRQQLPRLYQKGVLGLTFQKIMVSQILDQFEGDKVCGPDQSDKLHINKRTVGLVKTISSQNISAEVKFVVMQRAVAICPKVTKGCERKGIPTLLDSGSQVTLICQSYFEHEILPHIRPSGGKKAEALQLTAANN